MHIVYTFSTDTLWYIYIYTLYTHILYILYINILYILYVLYIYIVHIIYLHIMYICILYILYIHTYSIHILYIYNIHRWDGHHPLILGLRRRRWASHSCPRRRDEEAKRDAAWWCDMCGTQESQLDSNMNIYCIYIHMNVICKHTNYIHTYIHLWKRYNKYAYIYMDFYTYNVQHRGSSGSEAAELEWASKLPQLEGHKRYRTFPTWRQDVAFQARPPLLLSRISWFF